MKIVIAGGTGFIGSHLCRTLIEDQHEVTVKDVRKFDGNGLLVGFATITVDGITIPNCLIKEGRTGVFTETPNKKGKDGKYYPTIYISGSERWKAINKAITAAYKAAKKSRKRPATGKNAKTGKS